jgi:hypothetical protein
MDADLVLPSFALVGAKVTSSFWFQVSHAKPTTQSFESASMVWVPKIKTKI